MLKKLPLKGYVYFALTLDLVDILIIFLTKSNLPPVVPLFYGRPVGSEQLISIYGLLIAPLSASIIAIINLILSSRIKDDFSKKIISMASFFVSILATIAVVKIIFLVGFW